MPEGLQEKNRTDQPKQVDRVNWMDQLPQLSSGGSDLKSNPFGLPKQVALLGDPPTGTPRLPSPFGGPVNPDKKETPGSRIDRENHHGGWPVHRFPEQPGPGPGPGGTTPGRPIGPLDVPNPIVKRPGTEQEARNSVYHNTDGRYLLLAGAGTGALVQTSVWGLDKYTGAIDPCERSGWVKCWRDRFSPAQAAATERKWVLSTAESMLSIQNTRLGIYERSLSHRDTVRTDLAQAYRLEIPRTPLSDLDRRFYEGRVDILHDKAKYNKDTILANAGSEVEVANRTKLFTQTEAEGLATHATKFWGSVAKRDEALKCVRAAELSRDNAAKAVVQAERGALTTGSDSLMKGLGQGLGIAALTIGADMALDKAMGNNPELKPYTSWGMQGVGLPLIFMSRLSTPGKIVCALGTVGLSHLIDRTIGPPTGMFSTFARPNVPEMVLVTGSLLAPVRDWRIKTAMVAGSWLAGRAYNLLNDRYEFEGTSQAKMQNDARTFVEVDKQERKEATFEDAVARTKRFAKDNENAATLLVSDWQAYSGGGGTLLEVQRGRAALMVGLGEARLDKGTRIDQREYDRGDRVLAGLNYDLGGEAANFFRAAHTSLDECQKYARANKGRSVNGRAIDDAEIAQYDKLKQKVEQQLSAIYGSHDIDAVMKELRFRAQSQPDDLKRFGENLKGYADSLTDADPRHKSKILRDLSLLHVAFSNTADDPTTKSEHLSKAMQCYEIARRLNPDAPDMEKIRKLLSL